MVESDGNSGWVTIGAVMSVVDVGATGCRIGSSSYRFEAMGRIWYAFGVLSSSMTTTAGRGRVRGERVTYRAEDWRDADSSLAALASNVSQAIAVVAAGVLALASTVLVCVLQWSASSVPGWHVVLCVGSLLFPGSLVWWVGVQVLEPLVRRMVFPRRRSR